MYSKISLFVLLSLKIVSNLSPSIVSSKGSSSLISFILNIKSIILSSLNEFCDNNIKLLQSYTNGNYIVKIYSDGTKIRITEEDKFIPEFPESIDMKITDYCEVGCPMCHENSSIKGKHANFNYKFLDTLKEGTEISLGGGSTLSHPNLKELLEKLNSKNIICNMTIHNSVKEIDLLTSFLYKGQIKGLGISANNPKEFNKSKSINTVVYRIIISSY